VSNTIKTQTIEAIIFQRQ